MRLILAMIQVICLMAAQSPDYSNQSRLIRRLFLGRVVVVMVVKGGGGVLGGGQETGEG